jgi:nucleosome binding factor SPN SPT16 subunit
LAFHGNTGKATVVVMPTVNCLVQLIETPYTVISLDDIEIASLERVGFNTSTFDLVVIFKDFSRDAYSIGSVPAKKLDEIKKWLSTQDIKFFESKIPLQWKKILKQITEDPEGFMQVVCPEFRSKL